MGGILWCWKKYVAEPIDRYWVSTRDKVVDRAEEEWKQLNNLGPAGYVQQNTITLMAMSARALGADDIANDMEELRPESVARAREIEAGVFNILKREYNQVTELGILNYGIQNCGTLLYYTCSDLGLNRLADYIKDSTRREGEKQEQSKDADVTENSWKNEFVPGQIRMKYLMEYCKTVGDDELLQEVKAMYDQCIESGMFSEKRIVPPYADIPSDAPGLESKTKSSTQSVNEGEIQNITEIDYLYDYGMATKDMDVEGVDIAGRIAPLHEYESALINREINENHDLTCLSASIDGRKHGACVVIDSENEIVDVKYYNHGEEIDLSNANVEFSIQQDEQGNKYYSSMLNGKPFGWAMSLDSQGKAKVVFFDENGVEAYAPILNLNDTRVSGCDLAQELTQQKGSEQQLTGQYALSNAKLNVSLATRTKESNEPVIEEVQVRTSSSRPLNTPELER